MNILDKTISFFSPSRGIARIEDRNYLTMLERQYDAATSDRLHSDWMPVGGMGEQVDKFSRGILRGRARNMEQNSDQAEAVAGALVRNVIGTGIKPQARVRTDTGELDDATNKILEDAYKEWRKPENCDVTGQQTMEELQSMCFRRMIYDGEVFINSVFMKGTKYPLQLQVILPERVSSFDSASTTGNRILSGIELTEYYKPLNYYVTKQDPLGYTAYESEAIPANMMSHLFIKTSPTQIRGVTMFARVMDKIRQVDQYLDADLIAARAAACYAAFIIKPTGRPNHAIVNKDKSLTPGMIATLNPGEDIRFSEPKRNAGTPAEYAKTQGRRIASGMNLSYDIAMRDISGNFSAARQNLLEDRKTFRPLQQFMIDHFCDKKYRAFVTACYLNGILPAPDFAKNPEKYFAVEWQTPGWSWIDPQKEVAANKESLKGGLTTLAEVCSSQGLDWEEVMEQQAYERRRAKELGLYLDIFDPTSTIAQPMDDGKNNDSNDEGGEEDDNGKNQ